MSKIVRERAGEVYRRRYCDNCGQGHTTLERVVKLNQGARAERDIGARAVFNPGQWWRPDAPPARAKRTVRAT